MITKWFKKAKEIASESTNDGHLIEKSAVYYIPCDLIRSNAMRSRCDFNEDKLISLAYSIKRYGIIEPICVRKTDAEDIYDYELIVGERRLRAAKLAGITSVPCVILDIDDGISAELSIVENTSSEPLNCFELAVALERISNLKEKSLDELAIDLSIPQCELSKKLWLLKLDYDERQMLLNMSASEDIAVSIAKISDKARRTAIIERISACDMSNNEIKRYIEHYKNKSDFSANEIPRDIASVLKGFSAKVDFLNRRRKRAEMKVLSSDKDVTIEIKIKP